MRRKFIKSQIETATQVMMESRIVQDWVKGQARFLEVDLNSREGQEFWRRETRKAAERLVKSR